LPCAHHAAAKSFHVPVLYSHLHRVVILRLHFRFRVANPTLWVPQIQFHLALKLDGGELVPRTLEAQLEVLDVAIGLAGRLPGDCHIGAVLRVVLVGTLRRYGQLGYDLGY